MRGLRANLAVGLVFISLATGCSRSEKTEEAVPIIEATSEQVAARTNRMAQGDYLFELSLGAYERVGEKDPEWDESAKELMQGWIRWKAGEIDVGGMGPLLKKSAATDCADPLVNYMELAFDHNPDEASERTTNTWAEAATAIQRSGYHPYWKFYSALSAARAMKSVAGVTNTPIVHHFRQITTDRLIELVQDSRAPAGLICDAANWYVNKVLRTAPKMRNWTYEQIEPHLIANWDDSAEFWAFKGKYYIAYAWDARGVGWADSVTEEGWRVMGERLAVARESLNRAWSIKPTDDVATDMIRVELGNGQDRDEMERWFQRAMELNPANYDACHAKLTWLLPKWFGSAEEAIAFGKECLNSKKWRGNVPLTLYAAHQELAYWQEQTEQGTEADYWKRWDAWRDVKESFEKFFQLNPEATAWRHDYALVAYKSEAWEVLAKQIKLLGPVNYNFFGGEEKFQEMVFQAYEHVGSK